MYKNKFGDLLFEGDVVKDPHNGVWYIESFCDTSSDNPRAKCKNGCCFCTWTVSELMGIMHID